MGSLLSSLVVVTTIMSSLVVVTTIISIAYFSRQRFCVDEAAWMVEELMMTNFVSDCDGECYLLRIF